MGVVATEVAGLTLGDTSGGEEGGGVVLGGTVWLLAEDGVTTEGNDVRSDGGHILDGSLKGGKKGTRGKVKNVSHVARISSSAKQGKVKRYSKR